MTDLGNPDIPDHESWPDQEPLQSQLARAKSHLACANAVIERQEWEIHNLNTLLNRAYATLRGESDGAEPG